MAKKQVKKQEKVVKQDGDALSKARTELFSMKADLHLRKLKNTRSIFLKRKEIARLLTAQNMQKSIRQAQDKGGKHE